MLDENATLYDDRIQNRRQQDKALRHTVFFNEERIYERKQETPSQRIKLHLDVALVRSLKSWVSYRGFSNGSNFTYTEEMEMKARV